MRPPPAPFLHPDEWARHGYGRSFEFHATESEIWRIIAASLPAELGPYTIEGCKSERVSRFRRARHPLSLPLDRWPEAGDEMGGPYFIRSQALTPVMPLEEVANIDAALSLNGLIIYDPNRRDRGWHSDLGLVDRVVHRTTGAVVVHAEYCRLYMRLKRQIRKRLIPVLIRSAARGEEAPPRKALVSRAFLEAHQSDTLRFELLGPLPEQA